jgi:hypothetical protein
VGVFGGGGGVHETESLAWRLFEIKQEIQNEFVWLARDIQYTSIMVFK